MHLQKVNYGIVEVALHVEDCQVLANACSTALENLCEADDQETILLMEALGSAFKAAGQLADLQMNTPVIGHKDATQLE